MMHSLFSAKHAPDPTAAPATVQGLSPKTTESLLQRLGRSSSNMCNILLRMLWYDCCQLILLSAKCNFFIVGINAQLLTQY